MSTPPLNTTAGVALELLRSIAKSTEVFPPLQSVAELALHITEIVKEFHVSKNEWIELGIYVRDATANVTQSVAQVGAFHEDTKKNLEKLQSTLREIARTVEAEQKSPWHKRIGGLMKRPEIIESMRKRIDDAIGLFQLSATVMTMMDLKTTVDAVIANGKTLSGIVDKAASISRKASHIDLNATLSKLQRVKGSSWDPSRACMKDTRVELIKRVVAWLNSPTKSGGAEIMLMTAVAGAGKTTVAHTVARECHERKQLGSSFFFDRETEGRNSPVALITTIVADLSRLSQGLGNRITTAIEQDPSLPSAPLSRQFEELLLKPCIECPIAGPIVIVIDALDEAWSNDMLDILCNGVPQLPQTFRIFLTSRMRSEFDGLLRRTHVVGEELNIGAQSNMNDIEVYVPSMLRKLADDRRLGSDWPGEELQRQFTAKSDGLFLWVATVCSYLLHREDPTEELRELISMTGLSGSTAGDHMNRLYARILESFDWTDTRFVATYRRVMGTAIATKTPLTIHAMKQLYHGKPLASDFTLQKLNPLLTGMRAADHETQPVRVLHQSLRDFLVVQATSSSTETGYKIVEQEWSQELALLCLELLNRDLKPDTPGTGFLTEGEESAAGVPACDVIPEALRYACLHWQNHLCDAKLSKQVEDALTQFMGHRLVQWMEVSAVCGRYGGISQAQHWMQIPEFDKQVTGSTSCTQLSQLYNQVYARASSLLGSRLRYDDRREEALISGEEAVKVYERLSADEPAAFTPTLADSLNNLSIHLSDLGRREEALATIEEATQLIRQLAADRPAAFTPVLANSLNNLSLCLSDLGRREDALATVEEATQLRRQLAADRPAAFTPVLAESLNNLSNRLSDLGRREDALATIEEATQLRRQLAADRPAAFTPVLADSLNNLSNRLSDLGRREEALATIEEATQLYRQLAADRPAPFTPPLADSLNNLSN
ncbi:POC1 centriolar protein A, partial [Ceratobasidium sp. 392]